MKKRKRNKRKRVLFKLSLFCILITLVCTIKNRKENNIVVLSDSMDVKIISNGKGNDNTKIGLVEIENTEDEEAEEEFEHIEELDICEKEITNELIESVEEQEEIVESNTPSPIEESKEDEAVAINVESSTESTTENITFEVTFYTSLNEENGYGAITASGKELGDTMLLASNIYPFDTVIYLEGFGELEVQDRGGKEFNSSNRLDIYIPRNQGESDAEYKKRVTEYGRRSVSGKIL